MSVTAADRKLHIQTRINNEATEFLCEPRHSLLEVLRDILQLTGSKEGCNNGNCGACCVILDGRLVNSCVVMAGEIQGAEITTIEGLATESGELHPLQQKFLEHAALQCGICTPGSSSPPRPFWIGIPILPNTTFACGWRETYAAAQVRQDHSSRIGHCRADQRQRLTEGESRLMATATKTAPETQSEYKVIGTRPIRHDGVDKVTGRAQYGADVYLTGMLHGNVLRSPHAHARIVSIDAGRALALPGVKAVVTGKDLPDPGDKIANLGEASSPLRHLSLNVLAQDKVLYQGHAVAAVAATDPHLAEEATGLIEVDYEVLPPVMDVMEAMKDGAPLLDESLRTKAFGAVGDKPTNVADHIHFKLGDVEKGFAEADLVVEREFTTQTVHQGYIEPHNCTAFWNSDGQLTIWLSTQGSFTSRAQTSEILGSPSPRSRWCPPRSGEASAERSPPTWSRRRLFCPKPPAGRSRSS